MLILVRWKDLCQDLRSISSGAIGWPWEKKESNFDSGSIRVVFAGD
jgi:hypothetical protein